MSEVEVQQSIQLERRGHATLDSTLQAGWMEQPTALILPLHLPMLPKQNISPF